MTKTPAQLAFDKFRATASFGSLDGLRCLSIIAVVWHHAGTKENSWRALDRGFLGVDLFFVISGFLIVTLLLRERSATGDISLPKFYIRRTLRIFPLYYGVILSLAAFYAMRDSDSIFGARFIGELPYYLTFTANFVPVVFGISWSLAAEEQFYLLWPSVEKYLQRYVLPVFILLVVINQIANFQAGKNAISNMIQSVSWTQLSIFQTTFTPILFGAAAAHLLHSERSYRQAALLVGYRWTPAVYALALMALITASPPDISGFPRLLIQICMTLLLMSCVYQEDHVLRRLLVLLPVQRIGRVSYGMYLFHTLLIIVAAHLLREDLAVGSIRLFAVALLSTVVVAELSFRFFESPILRLKGRYSVVHQSHF